MAVRYHVLEARDNIRQKVLFIVFAIFVIFMANTFVVLCIKRKYGEYNGPFSKVYANLGGKIIATPIYTILVQIFTPCVDPKKWFIIMLTKLMFSRVIFNIVRLLITQHLLQMYTAMNL